MARQPPQPLAQSFLVCREIFHDQHTNEHILVGPFNAIRLPAFPAVLRVAVFIRMIGGHGAYQLGLQIRDPEDHVLGNYPGTELVHQGNPLTACQICWRDLKLVFPLAGKYDLILMANGEELAHHALEIIVKTNG